MRAGIWPLDILSGTPLFVSLFNNLAILVLLVAAYGWITAVWSGPIGWVRQAVLGLVFGVAAIACMLTAVPVADGVVVDLRNAVVAMSGAFGGPLAAGVAAVAAGLYRIEIGGNGVLGGLVGLGGAVVAGALLRWYRFRNPTTGMASPRSWIPMIGATMLVMPGFLVIGSFWEGLALLREVALPYGIATFLALFLIGRLLEREESRRTESQKRERLKKRAQDFANSASDWFWETDAGFCFTFISERFFESSGLKKENVLGKPRWAVGSECTDADWDEHRRILEARKPFRNFEYSRTFSDGSVHHFRVSGVPVYENGQFVGYRGSAAEITEAKEAERAVSEQVDLFRATIDALPMMISVKNRDLRYVYCNDNLARRWNQDPEAMIGRRIDDVVVTVPDLIEPVIIQDRKALATGQRLQFFEETLTMQGDRLRLLTTKVPILGHEGRFDYLVTISVDQTEQDVAQESLREALMRAEEASRAKSQFLATMSHEFRTPLNAIIGFSDMIKSEVFGPVGDPRYGHYAADINDSGKLMLALVQDLLDLSAIEAGRHVLKPERVDLRALLGRCTKSIEGDERARALTVAVHPAAGLPTVIADERAIIQIGLNLISNAIKNTLEGSVDITIEPAEGGVMIQVSDTGVGIPESKIQTVLEPFERLSNDPHVTNDGTGLGLSIVKSLVAAHGGRLTIASELGKGTTVGVWLPLDASEFLETAGPEPVPTRALELA